MAVSFDAFFYGISIQESGGNYKAVGPQLKSGRAYGKYQVMDFNIGPWTQKYLGRRLTAQQFLNSPDAQEKVARGVLKEYFDKYGARGAASAWYSGNPKLHMSTRPQGAAGPSIKSYVDSVLNHATKYKGGGGSGGGAGGAVSGSTLNMDELASQYGMTAELLNYYPELKKIFEEALAGNWAGARLKVAIENSEWWKNHTEAERKWILLNHADPAQAEDMWTKGVAYIQDKMVQWGVPADDKKIRDALVWKYVIFDWNEQQLKYLAADAIAFSKEGILGGEGGAFQNDVMSLAYANGVRMDPSWYKNWYQKILRGEGTKEQAMREVRNMAAAQFAGFKDQILAGQNVIDLASPYITDMARVLELGAGIDLFDPLIKNALSYKDPKTGTLGAKPLWQFNIDLRKDARWLKTNNAREGLMAVARQIGKDFGFGY